MLKRREFLKHTGAAAFGGLLLSKTNLDFFAAPKQHAVGLQLFTLFNVMDADVAGSLKKVAGIGYKEIESAFSKLPGYYGYKPKEFKKLLNDLGMQWKSHHVLGAPFKLPEGAKMPVDADGKPLVLPPMRNLRDNMQELVDEVAEGGVEYLVCAGTPIGNAEELKLSIDTLNKTTEAAKKAGLTFCYHNHDAEFKQLDGKIIYDTMLAETSCKMELDLCWVTKAGVDPIELFKKHPGRFPLWHVKDLDKAKQGPETVGAGVVDFKRIFANAKDSGMKHFFVEYDMPKDPYGSIASSFSYIKNTLKV